MPARRWLVFAAFPLMAALLFAADWPMPGGGPQRENWARSEHTITKANVKQLKLLYHFSAPAANNTANFLSPPIINGNLITYRGFKEMLMFTSAAGQIFSVDADLNQVIWQNNIAKRDSPIPARAPADATCSTQLAAAPLIMAGNSSAAIRFAVRASRTPAVTGAQPAPPPKRPSPYLPPLWQTVYPMTPNTLSQLASIYAISSDGFLHVLNSSTGEDLIAPVAFLPPHAKVGSLNIWQNTVLATTAGSCDGYRDSLYAVNLLTNAKQPLVFVPEHGSFAGSGGTAIGPDGTIYVGVREETRDVVLALNARDLTIKDSFSPTPQLKKRERSGPGVTPLVFPFMKRVFVATASRNGNIYLLDAGALGGADHHTPFWSSGVIARRSGAKGGAGFSGTFASWSNVDTQTRWIYLPFDGSAQISKNAVPADEGGLFALEGHPQNGAASFAPLWLSGNLPSPADAIIANGMIFTLANGGGSVSIHALDALSGREIWSSGTALPPGTPGNGLAVANGRVYATLGSSVYCFGLLSDQPQLAAQ